MPTPLNNQASIRYNYNNNTGSGTASSNTVTTNLLDQYTLEATKTPLSTTFRPGENITYVLRVENSGSGDLYNVTVADNLGGAGTPLLYNQGSLRVYVNGAPVPVSPTVTAGTFTATIPGVLPAGGVAILVYTAQVRPDVSFALQSITNTANVTANGGSGTGTAVAVDPAPTAVLLRDSYADVSLYKEADKQNVMAGDTLTYTFTLTNTGNQAADDVVLTDTLPAGYTVTQVEVISGGASTVLPSSGYTVDSTTNTITVPAAGATPITVPAATSTAPGVTTVVVTGTVSEPVA